MEFNSVANCDLWLQKPCCTLLLNIFSVFGSFSNCARFQKSLLWLTKNVESVQNWFFAIKSLLYFTCIFSYSVIHNSGWFSTHSFKFHVLISGARCVALICILFINSFIFNTTWLMLQIFWTSATLSYDLKMIRPSYTWWMTSDVYFVATAKHQTLHYGLHRILRLFSRHTKTFMLPRKISNP